MSEAVKAILDEEAERRREEARPPQPALFDAAPSAGAVPVPAERRGAGGRPPGSLNRSTREVAEFLRRRYGDALARGYELSARPIMTNRAELDALAGHLGCSRHEAAEFWARVSAQVYPYVYARLASVELKPPGTPGEAIPLFDLDADEETRIIDITDLPFDLPPEGGAPE